MYQKSDAGLIDYRQYRFGSLQALFRGPEEPIAKPYIVCLGAAQTFGRFVEHPYPSLLQERLGVRCVNLGAAGGGPDLFLADEAIRALCSGAEACVLQVMSGRSVSNAYYRVEKRRNAVIVTVAPELTDVAQKMRQNRKKLPAHDFLVKLQKWEDATLAERVFAELNRAWIDAYRRLLGGIRTRRVLFWFSERAPGSQERYGHGRLLMKFPQLIDKETIDAIRGDADGYVECISSVGLPQSLLKDGAPAVFKEKGKPQLENAYYPSPEMHAAAADVLLAPLREALEPTGRSAVP